MKKLPLSLLALLTFSGALFAQQTPPAVSAASNTIDLSSPDLSVETGHLKMGGKNPQGVEINATSRYLTLGGKPFYPILGEFHYARYPREQWEEELLKMKAGGINVVATYVFWIYHEEEEGKWDWSGNRDLHAFIELCAKHGLYAYPRFGPWAHGEVRNGALPDWVLQKCGKNVRKDDELYLSYVRAYFGQIAKQLQGLLWKDGGPVIGTQIENELTNNPRHLLTLKNLAREVGVDVPLYSITGWMSVQFPPDEMLPVFGGYPDAFWSKKTEGWARESRANYFFSQVRDDHTIGADLAKPGASRSNDKMARYPYGTVELGGGMQVSYRRRPMIEADDIASLAMVKLGSGSNMQGYYMYHGGANALGKLSTLNESRATGYPNDMPVINYDFQAPLGEYGQRRESYDALRIQHLFLHDFGADLAPMPLTLPDQQPRSMDDRETLRWSVRSDGKRGFIFVNNYQRVETLPAHEGVQFHLKSKDGALDVPSAPITIPAQSYFIWPVNMEIGGATLKYAAAQPLCRVGDTTVFTAIKGVEPEFAFEGKTIRGLKPGVDCVFDIPGGGGKILVLAPEQARQAYVAEMWGAKRLFLSKAGLLFDGEALRVQSRDLAGLSFSVYPAPSSLDAKRTPDGMFTRFTGSMPEKKIPVEWKQVKAAEPAPLVKLDDKKIPLPPEDSDFAERAGVWQITTPKDALEGRHKVFLRVDYVGDAGRVYLGDRFVDDDFYYGRVWEIGLNRFAPDVVNKGLTLKVVPLRKDAPIYISEDRLPPFDEKGEALAVRRVTAEAEYEIAFKPSPASP